MKNTKSNIKIFLSSPQINLIQKFAELVPNYKPNVLLTFYGLKKPQIFTVKYRHLINEIMLDCGAYSLHQEFKNESVDDREKASQELFNEYKIYTGVAQHQYDHIISMDDRFDPQGFQHNLDRLQEMESSGTNGVIPVIHNILEGNGHYDEIAHFIKAGYSKVAIGQCKGRRDLHNLTPAVNRMKKAGIDVHLFGITSFKIINHVPAYSCDSKTFRDYGIRGQVQWWNPNKKGYLDKTDTIYFPLEQTNPPKEKGAYYHDYEYKDEFEEHIKKRLNLTIEDLLGEDDAFNRQLVNILYFAELEAAVNSTTLF
jgi:hypothetical protein